MQLKELRQEKGFTQAEVAKATAWRHPNNLFA